LHEHAALAKLVGVTRADVTGAYIRTLNEDGHPPPTIRQSVYDLLQPLVATLEAMREGRDFTHVYWHRTDDGVTHLTLWDMDKPPDKTNTVVWSTPNSPTNW
jgi:hypothetical protein